LSETIQHGAKHVIVRACVAALFAVLAGGAGAATEYADRTDQQLTELAAGWENLSEDERRALLMEIKARMHNSASKTPTLTIKTERRYGKIFRGPDGSLVRIETTQHTIRYRALPEGASDQPFGVGFERRATGGSGDDGAAALQPSPPIPANAAPVVPVGHANQR
jgi:hypothetical protein